MLLQSSSQNIAAKDLVIKRRRANNPKPKVTLDLKKYTKEICEGRMNTNLKFGSHRDQVALTRISGEIY